MKRSWAKCVAAVLLAGSAAAVWAQAVDVEGVKFEPAVQVGGQSLQLNGTGVRTRAVFKVYAAGLYVPQKANDARALLAQKGPRRVTIGMLRDVPADTFSDALSDGLKANHTEAELATLQPQIDALNSALKSIGTAKKGDVILFEFTPDTGTRVLVNGQPRGGAMAGEAFFTAVLKVWIGDRPADAGLKKGLVGA